jgi:hypothetical protein
MKDIEFPESPIRIEDLTPPQAFFVNHMIRVPGDFHIQSSAKGITWNRGEHAYSRRIQEQVAPLFKEIADNPILLAKAEEFNKKIDPEDQLGTMAFQLPDNEFAHVIQFLLSNGAFIDKELRSRITRSFTF